MQDSDRESYFLDENSIVKVQRGVFPLPRHEELPDAVKLNCRRYAMHTSAELRGRVQGSNEALLEQQLHTQLLSLFQFQHEMQAYPYAVFHVIVLYVS